MSDESAKRLQEQLEAVRARERRRFHGEEVEVEETTTTTTEQQLIVIREEARRRYREAVARAAPEENVNVATTSQDSSVPHSAESKGAIPKTKVTPPSVQTQSNDQPPPVQRPRWELPKKLTARVAAMRLDEGRQPRGSSQNARAPRETVEYADWRAHSPRYQASLQRTRTERENQVVTQQNEQRRAERPGCLNCRKIGHSWKRCTLPLREGFCRLCHRDGIKTEQCPGPHGMARATAEGRAEEVRNNLERSRVTTSIDMACPRCLEDGHGPRDCPLPWTPNSRPYCTRCYRVNYTLATCPTCNPKRRRQ